jgi:phosphatidate cytidylyltransferase
MLKTRILTALVLLAVFLPALFWLPPGGWFFLIAVITGLAAWEWAGLSGLGKRGRAGYGFGIFVLMYGIAAILEAQDIRLAGGRPGDLVFALPLLGLCALFWLGVVPLWLWFRWPMGGIRGLVIGLFALLPAALVIAEREIGEVLLYFLSIAWVADIAAGLAGRGFGKHRLAPAIHPGKTWEGTLGAVIGVFLYLLPLFSFRMRFWWWDTGDVLLAALILAPVLTAVCLSGDLFESLLKRQAGVKDSGNLLPGGGILDRIASQLAVIPVALEIFLVYCASAFYGFSTMFEKACMIFGKFFRMP